MYTTPHGDIVAVGQLGHQLDYEIGRMQHTVIAQYYSNKKK